MELREIMDDMRTFVRRRFEIGDADASFDDDVHLFDYGYVDSFGAVEVTSYAERKFGIAITDEDLVVHPMNTIREIATFIQGRMARS